MTGNINFLSNVQKIKYPQYVTVANGAKIPIQNIGTMNVFSKIIPNVL